jgi:hypothetical protein
MQPTALEPREVFPLSIEGSRLLQELVFFINNQLKAANYKSYTTGGIGVDCMPCYREYQYERFRKEERRLRRLLAAIYRSAGWKVETYSHFHSEEQFPGRLEINLDI